MKILAGVFQELENTPFTSVQLQSLNQKPLRLDQLPKFQDMQNIMPPAAFAQISGNLLEQANFLYQYAMHFHYQFLGMIFRHFKSNPHITGHLESNL